MSAALFDLSDRLAVVVGGSSGIGRTLRTDLNSELLESPRGQELLIRTPMRRFGRLDELVGATIFLASEPARARWPVLVERHVVQTRQPWRGGPGRSCVRGTCCCVDANPSYAR